MNDDIFKTARDCINKSLIEKIFYSPKGNWKNDDYWTLNPLRNDKSPGSFHVNSEGLWYDHSTKQGGDLIEFFCQKENLDKLQAAEHIIKMAGSSMPEKTSEKKNNKKNRDPLIPIPPDKIEQLHNLINSEWILNNDGNPVQGWQYKNENGEILFCTVRHEKEKEKSVKPYYFDKCGKWKAGNPYQKNIPLYGLWKLKNDDTVLIVEGEKCADINVDEFNVISWCGGVNQVHKADWSVLKNKKIIIWPDFDKPGLEAAIQIKEKFPEAKILKIENKPEKWDIYDAKQDGLDLIKFINECPEYIPKKPEKKEIEKSDNMPFKFMGFDDNNHYFLPAGSKTIKHIGVGSFSKNKLLEIAPLSFWINNFDQRKGYDFESAVDWIIRESELKGFFRPDLVRGTGVWLDQEKIILNNGNYIVNGSGERLKNFKSNYFYVRSERKMGNFDGIVCTKKQGEDLIKLFQCQGFESKIESWISCGWSLISPFAGILNWRPHIWITGPTQCGKSYLLREIIYPLCGKMAEIGTGKTSAPGIYRALKSSAAPVILDEMEPGKNKETRMRIEEKLEIARNASSDFSANMSLASKSGGVDRFCVRSPFCFSSVIPYFMSEAIENRVLICRLKNFSKAMDKRNKTKEIMRTGIFEDTGIFRRKIYKNLNTIIKNIHVIKKIISDESGDNRKADNLSGILAAIFILIDEKELSENIIKPAIIDILKNMDIEIYESDEDKLISHIFDTQIKNRYNNEFVSIAELIRRNIDPFPAEDDQLLLWRHGLKIYEKENIKYLAIARQHVEINRLLNNTQYEGRYVDILKRHPAAVEKNPVIRFAGQSKSAILLKWSDIEEKHYNEKDDNETLEIPF